MGGRELEVFEGQNEGHCDRPSVGGSDWPGRDMLETWWKSVEDSKADLYLKRALLLLC